MNLTALISETRREWQFDFPTETTSVTCMAGESNHILENQTFRDVGARI
jgi:hypothetical protein